MSIEKDFIESRKKNGIAAEYVDINSLKLANDNPRINDHVVEKIAKSIQSYGFASPIVAQIDGTILAGHTRWKAAKSLNMNMVPCRYMNISGDKAKLYRIADNKLSEYADWDMSILEEQLEELKENYQLELDDMGFGEIENFIDYEILNSEEIDEEMKNLSSSTRTGIMVECTQEEYEETYELCNYFRKKGEVIGSLLLQKLKAEYENE